MIIRPQRLEIYNVFQKKKDKYMTIKKKNKPKKMLQANGTGRRIKVISQAEGKNEAIELVEVVGPRCVRVAPECRNQSHLVTSKRNFHLVESLQTNNCRKDTL